MRWPITLTDMRKQVCVRMKEAESRLYREGEWHRQAAPRGDGDLPSWGQTLDEFFTCSASAVCFHHEDRRLTRWPSIRITVPSAEGRHPTLIRSKQCALAEVIHSEGTQTSVRPGVLRSHVYGCRAGDSHWVLETLHQARNPAMEVPPRPPDPKETEIRAWRRATKSLWPPGWKQLLEFSEKREQVSKETHLQTKLVEEIIDEILGTVNKSIIQLESCDVVEDGFRHRGWEVVPTSVVLLMAVDGDLKGQNGQHQQVVLEIKENTRDAMWSSTVSVKKPSHFTVGV